MSLLKAYISPRTTNVFYQCRNSSTRHGKKGLKNHPPSPKPKHKTPSPSDQSKYSELTTQTWVIEPRISYGEAKLRTPKSPAVILVIVGFALSSIYLTSTAFPDPSVPTPSTSTDTSSTKSQDSSLSSILLYPIKFVFRPLFVEETVIDDTKQTWRYKAGFAAGLASICLFTVSFLSGPRYVRYISISPRVWAGAGAGSGSGPEQMTKAGGGVMQIYPAFGRNFVNCPVARSTLVSPLLNEKQKLLSTIRILGAPRSLGSVGWGVNMFRDGAMVNGKVMDQEGVVNLMERIWVAHGGKITVA